MTDVYRLVLSGGAGIAPLTLDIPSYGPYDNARRRMLNYYPIFYRGELYKNDEQVLVYQTSVVVDVFKRP